MTALLLLVAAPAGAQLLPGTPAHEASALPDPEVVAELDDTDDTIEQQLRSILSTVERFSSVEVSVDHGVVQLTGEIPSSEDADDIRDLAKSLEGVTFVDDRTSQPVAVRDRLAPMRERAEAWVADALSALPLVLLALLAFALIRAIGRFLAGRDALVERAVSTPMLRELSRRVLRLAFSALGLLVALELLDATALVGTVLGAAGVAGIAAGFAFKDIAENYLASFLLASRRPFNLGDAVVIGDREGKVVRLTMRETVLMTFEGNHLSMPNAAVFKATVLNYSRNPRRRFDFEVGAGVDTDLHQARSLGVDTLAGTPGVLSEEQPPFSQIDELGDSNVALHFFGWVDQREADFFQVRSEAIRRVKVALEDAGVDMPEPIYRVRLRKDGGSPAPRETRENVDREVDVSPDKGLDAQIAREARTEENLLGDEPPAR